jgi:hypothetical protein
MNMIRYFVEAQLIESERKAIIADYDEWSDKGSIGDSVLRDQAKTLGIYLYGDNAIYCASVNTNMTDLYNAVCRYYAERYISKMKGE